MKGPRQCWAIIAFMIAFLIGGCISHTTFQSPRVLVRGQHAFGAGVAGWTSRYSSGRRSGLMEVDVFGRVGIASRVDAGIKLYVPFSGLFGDVKCQIRKSVPLISVGPGGSYGEFDDVHDSGDDFEYLGLYPVVLFGPNKFFGGLRMVYAEEIRHHSYGSHGTTNEYDYFPGKLLGVCLREGNVRALPEVTVYLHSYEGLIEGRVLTVVGVAFQQVSSTKEKEPE